MFFAFFALTTAFPLDVPKYSLMMIYRNADSSSCTRVKQYLDNTRNSYRDYCAKVTKSNFDDYFQCQLFFNYQDFFCSNSLDSFSTYISKVSSQSKLLFIYSELTADYTIDLRNIPSKIDVEITCGLPGTNLKNLDDSNLTSHRLLNSLKKLTNNTFPLPFQSANLKNPKVSGLKLGLVGDISSKVGSLSLSTNFQEFEITQSDLNIDSFSLTYNDPFNPGIVPQITVSTNSHNIRTKNFFVDPVFHMSFSKLTRDNFISVDSYILYFPDEYEKLVSQFQIGFNNNQWELQYKAPQKSYWEPVFTTSQTDPANSLLYSKAKMFGILSSVTSYDVKMISSYLPSGKSANIRFLDQVPSDIFYAVLTVDGYPIRFTFPSSISVTSSGDWSSVSKESLPTVYLTYDTDTMQPQIDSSDFDSLVGVFKKQDPINPAPEDPDDDDDDTNIGMIVGIVVGCVVVIAVIIIVVIVVIRKKKANQNSADQSQA